VWRLYPEEGYYGIIWLTGLWSTQAKVEGIVLKADGTRVVTAVSLTIPLGNQVASHCT